MSFEFLEVQLTVRPVPSEGVPVWSDPIVTPIRRESLAVNKPERFTFAVPFPVRLEKIECWTPSDYKLTEYQIIDILVDDVSEFEEQNPRPVPCVAMPLNNACLLATREGKKITVIVERLFICMDPHKSFMRPRQVDGPERDSVPPEAG